MYITFTVKAKGTRLAKPVMSLGLMCLAFLTGINRVAEYRNHWSDVIAGFIIGVAIATFLVSFVVYFFWAICALDCILGSMEKLEISWNVNVNVFVVLVNINNTDS